MRYFIIVLLLSYSCSCNIDHVVEENSADFMIVSKMRGITNSGIPTITILVQNVGNRTGYNLSCDIQVIKDDVIVGGAWAYFGGGGDIEPGQKAQDVAMFYSLSTINGHRLKYQLSWLEY